MITLTNIKVVKNLDTSLDIDSSKSINIETNISTDKILRTTIKGVLPKKTSLDFTPMVVSNMSTCLEIGGSTKSTNNHNNLKNLDYESSGHKGFASEIALTKVKNESVPRRLNEITLTKCKPSKQFIFIDDNGSDGKLSIKDINSRVLKTVDTIPSDIEDGEYIFKKI